MDEVSCAHCRGNNLHHFRVTVYDRQEDADTGMVTIVETPGELAGRDPIGLPSTHHSIERTGPGSGNPSGRRHGVVIELLCETCRKTTDLTVAQHKGVTLLDRRTS